MNGDHFTAVETALASRLRGDAELRDLAPGGVWGGEAPPRSPYPLVTFSYHMGSDKGVFGGRAAVELVYQVKAIDKSGLVNRAALAACRIDELLTSLEVDGFRCEAIFRETPVRYVEPDGDYRYQHVGGLYRIVLEAL
jgi:hypothetical protein